MRLTNVGCFDNINDYVKDKIERYSASERSFESLFEFMFSERDNVMAESSDGYRVRKQTYGEVHDRIVREAPYLAEALSDAPCGSLVGLYMSNSLEWIEVFWKLIISGYRPLLMNMRLDDELLESIIRDYSVSSVVSDGKRFSVKTVMISDVRKSGEAAPINAPFGREVLFMSSGTSRQVKLCAYTGENFFYQIADSAKIIENCPGIKEHFEGELKQLVLLPLYHVFGFIAVYVWFAFFSRTFVFPKELDAVTVLNTVKKHKVTHIFAVPMVWEGVYREAVKKVRSKGDSTYKKFLSALNLSEKLGSLGAKLSARLLSEVRENLFGESVKFLISGGSHIRPEVLKFFNGIGYRIANGYGMTEIGITSVEVSSKNRILNSGSVGFPFGNTEYSVGDGGELLVRGKTMASRIISASGERVTDFNEWFGTRDLVEYISGRYFIRGRIDDLVVCENGENLNPVIVEEELRVRSGCESLCLFADKNGIPTLVASAVGCYDAERLEAMRASLIAAIGELKLNGEIKHVHLTTDSLVEGKDFKVSRKKLAERYSSGSIRIIDPRSIGEHIEEIFTQLEIDMIALFAEALECPKENVRPTDNFFVDLGGSSLDYLTLLSLVKAKFGKSIESTNGERLASVREFCEYIKKS